MSSTTKHNDNALKENLRSTFCKLKNSRLAWPILELSRFQDDNEGSGSKDCREALQEIRSRLDRIEVEALAFLDKEAATELYNAVDRLYYLGEAFPGTSGNQISFAEFANIVAEVLSIKDSMTPSLIKLITITFALQNDNGLANRLKEADRLVELLREELGASAVHKNAVFFEGIADESRKAAARWSCLLAVTLMLILILGISLILLREEVYFSAQTPTEAVQLIALKLIIFGTLSYGAGFCARNYRAERHNLITNAHRATAIKTYRALMESATSENAQNIILSQAAASIFNLSETGFGAASKPSDHGPQVIIGSLLPKAPIPST